jgi:hypothetical protein
MLFDLFGTTFSRTEAFVRVPVQERDEKVPCLV